MNSTVGTGSGSLPAREQTREIVLRTRGDRHGPITRLVSPGDTGEIIKPFVFLDHFDFKPTGAKLFGMHPHSGLATITILLSGDLYYEDTTGASGELHSGSVEWMRAGHGVWHDGWPTTDRRFLGYQLWLALPPSLENAAAQSQYLAPADIPAIGPARVILGTHSGKESKIVAPAGAVTLHVRLVAGERWRFQPPAGHVVAWAHSFGGVLFAEGQRIQDELVIFGESGAPIEFEAEGDTEFIVSSGVKHPHKLVLGMYSVHTNAKALASGEAEIARIGHALRASGRLG